MKDPFEKKERPTHTPLEIAHLHLSEAETELKKLGKSICVVWALDLIKRAKRQLKKQLKEV